MHGCGRGGTSRRHARCSAAAALRADRLSRRSLSNEFTSDAGRWAANVINVELRTGIFVAICTLMRHAIDFELSKLNELGGHEAMLKILGIAAIAIAPAMNLIGGLVSVMRGTANHTSILCRWPSAS